MLLGKTGPMDLAYAQDLVVWAGRWIVTAGCLALIVGVLFFGLGSDAPR